MNQITQPHGSAPDLQQFGNDQVRPHFLQVQNGEPALLAFSDHEYEDRLSDLRRVMQQRNLAAVLFTSMHNVAYYSGFLYCSFGRPYACIVTAEDCITISANIDYGQPWRRCYGENLVYTDWQRDNYWRAIRYVIGDRARIGIEGDHLTVSMQRAMQSFLCSTELIDIASDCMQQRMRKSEAEIALITEGARIADLGGLVMRDAVKVGAREIDIAMAGRDAMELEIARTFPSAEYRDTWVWFQSGLNTDGAHNPITSRKIISGDILSMNAFPMICGYYTALERTLFADSVDNASLAIWQANVAAHELGLSLIKPGVRCSEVCEGINALLVEKDLLQFRSFGYGHSFGLLSHYYGREPGLEIREDIDTVLEPGMVISIEPMLTIPEGRPGSGGYREHDILVVTEQGALNITQFPYGPEHNVVT